MSSALPPVPLAALTADDPRVVGPYRLLGRLGTRPACEVFLAEGPDGWAVVRAAHSRTPGEVARWRRELEAMRTVSPPHAAAVLAHDLTTDSPWLAVEFVPGITLQQRVVDEGSLRPAEVRAFANDLALALAATAAAGVVHRDLQPRHVILSPRGPVLIDFSGADVSDATTLTQTGTVMGSVGWLAPEQVLGEPVTPATDVHAWALCVLYAAGALPAVPEETTAALYRVLHETPAVPSTLGEPLASLVSDALSKDPARRPAVSAIARTLSESRTRVESAPTTSTPPPDTRIPRDPTTEGKPEHRSGRALVWGAVAAALVLLLAAAAFALGRGGTSEAATPPVTARPTSEPTATAPLPVATVTLTTTPTAPTTEAIPAAPIAPTCRTGGACAVGDIGPGGGTVFYAGTVTIDGAARPGFLEVAPQGWTQQLRPGHPSYVMDPPFEDPRISWCDPAAEQASVPTQAGIGAGRTNTDTMVRRSCERGAAGLASSYQGGGLSDWYLPSSSELEALCRSRVDVVAPWVQQCDQTTANSNYNPERVPAFPFAYWSSTQTPDGTDKYALCQPCRDTSANDDDYFLPSPFYVRPIRVFTSTA